MKRDMGAEANASKEPVFIKEGGFWKAKVSGKVIVTCKTERACRRNFDLFSKNYPHLL